MGAILSSMTAYSPTARLRRPEQMVEARQLAKAWRRRRHGVTLFGGGHIRARV
jgi:hypothetical protein